MKIAIRNPQTPHPVTLVELLTWVYRDQKADRFSHVALILPGEPTGTYDCGSSSTDGCVKIARNAKLGASIPGTAHLQRPTLHRDADAVHGVVAALSSINPVGLLLMISHARAGSVPYVSDDIPEPRPVRRIMADGRESIVEDATLPGQSHLKRSLAMDPKTGRTKVQWVEIPHPFCPLDYWPSPAAIEQSRLDHRLWFQALEWVWRRLPPLTRWQVTELGAVARPWSWETASIGSEERCA